MLCVQAENQLQVMQVLPIDTTTPSKVTKQGSKKVIRFMYCSEAIRGVE
jgi:hypothetical protein